MDPVLRKLLSHRVRGFGAREHSRVALRRACASGVPYVELDTRVSRDGEIVLEHGAYVVAEKGRRIRLADLVGAQLRGLLHADGTPLLTLREALRIFREEAGGEQRICLDLKDVGFAAAHLSLVREAGLEERTVFVSWAPQALQELAAAGTTAPLVLSHWNLTRLGWIGRVLARSVRDRRFAVGPFVLLGERSAGRDLGATQIGHQHGLLGYDLSASLQALLRRSAGGICVHRSMLCDALVASCRRHGLQLWVFTTFGAADYRKIATRDGVDVVFCENAQAVLGS